MGEFRTRSLKSQVEFKKLKRTTRDFSTRSRPASRDRLIVCSFQKLGISFIRLGAKFIFESSTDVTPRILAGACEVVDEICAHVDGQRKHNKTLPRKELTVELIF